MDGNRSKKEAGGKESSKGRLWASLLVLGLMGLSQHSAAQVTRSAIDRANDRIGPKISLRAYNYGVSRALLAKAEREATTILNQAGVEVAWVECPLNAAGDRTNYGACRAPMGASDFAIKILTARGTERVSSYNEALGQALECAKNQVGCSAYIFYRDVLALAMDGEASEYQLLGHAMAHEIGHLLLGPNSHSASGVMRGHWNHQDLETMARANLFFTNSQSKQIQEASPRGTRLGRIRWPAPKSLKSILTATRKNSRRRRS